MSGRKKDEKAVSIPEVKEIMEYVKDKFTEIDAEEGMSHFQEITYSYVNKYSKMSAKEAKKIIKFLMDEYGIEELYAINIVNIDPHSVPELRMLLEKSLSGKTLNDKQLSQLLDQIEDIKTS